MVGRRARVSCSPMCVLWIKVRKPPFSCFPRWIAICAERKLENGEFTQQKLMQGSPIRQLGSHKELLDHLDRPDTTQVSLDSYVSLLHWCISSNSLKDGKRLHAHLIKHDLEHHKLIGCLLIQMYATCGAIHHAHALFASLPHQRICSWNIMIKGYVKHGQKKEAIHLYNRIEQEGLQPDQATFTAMMSGYTKRDDLDEGRQMHSRIVEDGYDSDNVVGTALVNMYGKCGDLESALGVSEKISVRDLVGWNVLVAVYVQHGKGKEALHLFNQMQQEGMVPSRVTFVNILAACTSKELLAEGQQVHAYIISSKCGSDTVVGTALMNMYGKCGSAYDARRVFDNLLGQDTVSWNAMIAVYTQHGLHKEALQLFKQMQQVVVVSDKVTFVSILDACVEQDSLREGKQMHTYIVCRGFQSDFVVGTALMNMYGKCGSLENAQKVFDIMPGRDSIAWNAMLAAQVQHEERRQTPQFFARMLLEGVLPCRATFASALSAFVSKEMLAEGERLHVHVLGSKFKSDIMMGNALVNMYGKCGCLDDAQKVFERLPERDVVSWNAIIAACAQHDQREKAWQLFEQMQLEGLRADKVTFVSILDACITHAALAKGKLMHSCIMANHFDFDIVIGTALVNMYGKCGSLKDAEEAFNHMPKQSVVSWNAMIATFAQHGKAKRGIYYFDRMKQEVKPDKVTFTIVLTACSHAGLVDEACNFFSSMIQNYGLSPTIDHYACMIDLLGRAGRLEEAENLLKIAPCERNAVLYMTLLGACRHQSDVERGEHAANMAFEFAQDDPTPFVMLSNIYSAASREVDEAI